MVQWKITLNDFGNTHIGQPFSTGHHAYGRRGKLLEIIFLKKIFHHFTDMDEQLSNLREKKRSNLNSKKNKHLLVQDSKENIWKYELSLKSTNWNNWMQCRSKVGAFLPKSSNIYWLFSSVSRWKVDTPPNAKGMKLVRSEKDLQ